MFAYFTTRGGFRRAVAIDPYATYRERARRRETPDAWSAIRNVLDMNRGEPTPQSHLRLVEG